MNVWDWLIKCTRCWLYKRTTDKLIIFLFLLVIDVWIHGYVLFKSENWNEFEIGFYRSIIHTWSTLTWAVSNGSINSLVEFQIKWILVVSGRFFHDKHSVAQYDDTGQYGSSEQLLGVDVVEFVMKVGHLVGEFHAVWAMRAVLHVPISQFEHFDQALVIIFEGKILVVFRENACSLEKLFCLCYFSDPGW